MSLNLTHSGTFDQGLFQGFVKIICEAQRDDIFSLGYWITYSDKSKFVRSNLPQIRLESKNVYWQSTYVYDDLFP